MKKECWGIVFWAWALSPCGPALAGAVPVDRQVYGGEVIKQEAAPVPGEPALDASEKERMVDEILELGGVKEQIANIPSLIPLQLEEMRNRYKPEVFEVVSKSIYEAYQAEKIYGVIRASLVDRFDRAHYTALLDWLHSPLSRKMSRLEEEASTPEALRGMKEFAAGFQQAPPPPQRLALLREFDQALGVTSLNIEMVVLVNVQALKALERALPEDEVPPGNNWEEDVATSLRSQLELPMEEITLISFLYAYRSATDEELREYINFWSSDEGRWSNQLLKGAFLDAMAGVGQDLGRGMADNWPAVRPAE